MKLSVSILDDSPQSRETLNDSLKKWSASNNVSIDISMYKSGDEYFRANSESTEDIIFLDVEMPNISGMDVAERLRSLNYCGIIVFVTAFSNYAINGYDVNAFRYLLKPLNFDKLALCMSAALDEIKNRDFVYTGKNGIQKIPFSGILCFSSSLHYIEVLTREETVRYHGTFNNLADSLPEYFVRTHRSYFVNMNCIEAITNTEITLSNKTKVPLARSYKSEAIAAYTAHYTKNL